MDRQITANYEALTAFLESHMQENQRYKAGRLYETYREMYPEDGIRQKDFAMFLRYQVEKEDGLLKRTAHGIYEKRTDPDDHGIKFPRKDRDIATNQNFDILYLDRIHVSPQDADLEKLYDDTINLMARMRYAVKNIQAYAQPCPEFQLELESYLAGMMKNMDNAATGVSAIMAWCDDHFDEIALARDIGTEEPEEETMMLQM